MFVECFQLNTLLMSVIDRTELTSNVPNKLVYGMRKKFPYIYILAYLPVILLEIVLLSKEVYKMFETGKKTFTKIQNIWSVIHQKCCCCL